ncbi:O-antigen polymerase [Streptococcus lutetiensis]|uniref:O-antigen polymerase n=1 Tax=Streptococcus lutetiensis TaxID=150055 RepID=UPI001BD93BBC|nr:O-antigen polymerase [Streptococcus lutetiensis]MBT0946266.1 oligosaccharide repeat unit polymerase [Streptococcus lutetiensis]
MIFYVTFFTIFVLFGYNFFINNKELTSPAVLFSFSFVVLMIFAFINYSDLGLYSLNWRTSFVIIIGILSFMLGTLPFVKMTNRISFFFNEEKGVRINQKVSVNKLLIFLLFGFFILILNTKYLGISTENYSSILGDIRDSTVNSGSGVLPKYLVFSNMIMLMGGIFFSIELPRFFIEKDYIKVFLSLVIFLLSILISFSGGSRGSSLILIISLIFNSILESYKNNKLRKIKISSIIKVFLIIIVLLYLFKESAVILGQTQVADFSFSRYILLYVGAQLKNLDMALTYQNIINSSNVFGQETFRSFVKFFSNLIGSGLYGDYKLFLPFNYYNGISLGNVYTTFYPFLRDFGYFGVIICSMFMGVISEYLYYLAKKFNSWNDGVSIWNILLSWSSFCLLFSFFSNKFYENIFSLDILNYIVASIVVLIFFFGFPLTRTGKLRRLFF